MSSKTYIVGGYVRDRLLGLESKDHDFVVVGSTPEEMLAQGFKQVGADFPVFLHPLTGDEYALARTERKVGAGYNGFETDFNSNITLEEDLVRRDLTINAMAREVVGWNELGHAKLSDEVIDPFGGQEDLENEVLRHVSDAFAEDPVRVLRVARFAARYGFRVDCGTRELMWHLVDAGELDHLVPERVWAETEKALGEDNPVAFFKVLEDCRARDVLFPELELFNDGNFRDLNNALELSPVARFAALMSTTDNLDDFCARLKVPNNFHMLAGRVRMLTFQCAFNMFPTDTYDTLLSLGTFHQGPEQATTTLRVAQTLDRSDLFVQNVERLLTLVDSTAAVRFVDLTAEQQSTLKGPAVGDALRDLRLNILNEQFRRSRNQST